ncbi:hypothetical protein [Janibacter cremeus]|uniref:Uncharacterized protein n=1 Tax=Janibacter cremeus TaxID=1285192 RepID=A0A852VWF5_9MICO|nr:hypothetical protein [Janibacter cremeus]NYF98105.1 hypothetical protein [Janibacter cremeus]
MSNDQSGTEGRSRRHTAGALDVRNIIGALLVIYGVILLLVHFISGSDTATSGPTHEQANLWTGAALLVAGILFFVWTRVRPIVVDEAEQQRLEEEKRELGTPGSTSD